MHPNVRGINNSSPTTKYQEFIPHFISLGEATSEVLNPLQELPPLNTSA